MRALLLLLASCFCCAGFSQTDSSTCNFKQGSFYVLNGKDTCFIKRTADRQTEQCSGSDNAYEFIVVWLSDNKYILRDINYNPTTAKRVMRKDLVMTILEVGDNYHIVHMKSKENRNRQFTVYCNEN